MEHPAERMNRDRDAEAARNKGVAGRGWGAYKTPLSDGRDEMSGRSGGFAAPRHVESLDDCCFYHTVDLPGLGTVEGPWDLRGGVDDYLGHVDLRGGSVFEPGPASGFLTFEMEKRGALVTAYDLSEEQEWDVIPYAGRDASIEKAEMRAQMRRINNSFWLGHRLFGSHARLAHGHVYEVPDDIGTFDTCLLGSILLHLRDPFLAMQKCLSHTTGTAIVTDLLPRSDLLPKSGLRRFVTGMLRQPSMGFAPDGATLRPTDTWWKLHPEVVVRMLGVLGFGNAVVTYHRQTYRGRRLRLFTVVAHRTRG